MDIRTTCLGKNIRQKRKEQNATLSMLAEKCNMSENFLGNIERGTDTPSLKYFIRICNALNTSADSLLFENLNIYANDITEDHQLKIAKEIMTLTKEQQKKLFDIICVIKEF